MHMFIWAMFGAPAPIGWIIYNIIYKMDNEIGFEAFYRCRGNAWTMCEFHGSNGNGFGDIWWTDKLFYFSSI